MPTSPAGTVPRAWPIVLSLALTARPRLATSGLIALLRGKMLRVRNRRRLAAAQHSKHYAMSIRVAELALLPAASASEPGLVGAINLGGDSAGTRASLTASLGPDLLVVDASVPLPASNRPTWLLPIEAGDQVSPALDAVLTTHVRGSARLVYWGEIGRCRKAPWIKPGWDPLLFHVDAIPDTSVERWSDLSLTIAEGGAAPRHLPLVLTHRSEPRVRCAEPSIVTAPPVAVSSSRRRRWRCTKTSAWSELDCSILTERFSMQASLRALAMPPGMWMRACNPPSALFRRQSERCLLTL